MADPFNRSHQPVVGEALQLTDLIRVVTAPNASPMTFTGTQTYLVGSQSVAVIDPGPDDPDHFDALMRAIDGHPVSHILITHSHVDHSPLSRRLAEVTRAPIMGFGPAEDARSAVMNRLAALGDLGGAEGLDSDFRTDKRLLDGDLVTGEGWNLEVCHTPGHLSNHLCFGLTGTGVLFTGDHVMGWATTMVSPPDGDLTRFMTSLEKLLTRTGDTTYLPGHGDVVTDPHGMVRHQIGHRRSRESQVLQQLAMGPATAFELATRIYTDIDQRLIPAAARNVFAHLIDLSEREIVTAEDPISTSARFALK